MTQLTERKEIVDFDRNRDNKEVLTVHYEDRMQEIPFSVTQSE